ncbi:ABC transporter permease [Kribbella italica]|uniref:NitT/TauT family transport system permease protein n=1 Tax=Kribbella italica TaxID=1540520 RepID=A0A7W9MSJ9_9ACTN|nr:ABC transporter permease [Kribbella italica]MBB5833988.1 NitT/TauT family transport system permease protein [Kribbella italica]
MPPEATRVRPVDAGSVEAGLDALDTPVDLHRETVLRRIVVRVLPPIGAIALFVLVWQLLWAAAFWPEFKLPAPADVGTQIWQLVTSGDILELFWTSVHRAVIGFGISLLIAVPLGLAIANITVVRRGIGPLVSGLQSLPSVAWVPAAILWFGLNDRAIYWVVLLGAVPSIANGLVSGLDQVPPILPRVGKALGAGRWSGIRYILLPAALPGFLGGLKQGWAFSWRSLMAAELIATSPDLGEGLGQYLHNAMSLSDISMVFAGILLIFVVGVGIELAVFRPLENSVLRARGLTQGRK